MLIERQIEETIKTALAEKLDGCEIVGSWSPADSGKVKGEHDNKAKAIVSIYIQPRAHDAFSLPTVNIVGTIAIDARVEMCPTMAEVSEIYEKVLKLLDDWHYDGYAFSEAISTEDFFGAELRLDGGDRVSYDANARCWIVQTSFTIRGTVNHDLVN